MRSFINKIDLNRNLSRIRLNLIYLYPYNQRKYIKYCIKCENYKNYYCCIHCDFYHDLHCCRNCYCCENYYCIDCDKQSKILNILRHTKLNQKQEVFMI